VNGGVVLLKHEAALVRLMELGALTTSPAHYHSKMHEQIVCLEGKIAVFSDSGRTRKALEAGDHVSIPPRVVHWLQNESNLVSKYLLIQSGGEYDFVEITV
jgi:quercetin dioxygenase-like cupin family protein